MDDDDFLYGSAPPGSSRPPSMETFQPPPNEIEKQPKPMNPTQTSNGVIAHLESEASLEVGTDGEAEDFEEEESEDDVEIIMDAPARTLDFRQNPPGRPAPARTSSLSTPARPAQPSLTTEYTPRERGGGTPLDIAKLATTQRQTSQPIISTLPSQQSHTSAPPSTPVKAESSHLESLTGQPTPESGPDPSTLPPVTAPPSHPSINPALPGTLDDGRSILEVDLSALAEKTWRRPGSDISDWFNYGFDEISWEAYCYRRREVGDAASVLKNNVVNFAGMPEDQLAALPPEIRTMVMTGATALMTGGAANQGMIAPIHQIMHHDMGMNMMGINGDMITGGSGMMQDGSGSSGGVGSGVGGPGIGGDGVQGQGMSMGMQDGFVGPGGPGPGIMGMGNEFSMQDPNPMGQQMSQQMGQQMYPGMDMSAAPMGNTSVSGPGPGPGRGSPAPFRGRGIPMRGRGAGYVGRGRGRGGFGSEGGPPIPVRPASPLPPGVPTGPRNLNKYKDRDGNAPAVDGLDYGGTNKDTGGGTSVDLEERGRKRRNTPNAEDGSTSRGSKRR